MEKNRIEYLDCLRGLAILMVVFVHVSNFCLHIEGISFFMKMITIIIMPLFFFVSGLFTHTFISKESFLSRVYYVLFPTLVTFVLYTYVTCCQTGQSMHHLIFQWLQEEYKGGYWFTMSLVLMNSLHFLGGLLLKKMRIDKDISIIVFLLVCSLSIIIIKEIDWSNNGKFCGWFSLRLLSSYFPFYIMGIISKWKWSLFNLYVTKAWLKSSVFVCFILFLCFIEGGFYMAIILSVLGVITMYAFVKNYSSYFSKVTLIGRSLSYVGKHTLSIYLLHYFFFSSMAIPRIVELATMHIYDLWVFFVACFCSVVLVCLCLVVDKIIAAFPLVHRLTLGK